MFHLLEAKDAQNHDFANISGETKDCQLLKITCQWKIEIKGYNDIEQFEKLTGEN